MGALWGMAVCVAAAVVAGCEGPGCGGGEDLRPVVMASAPLSLSNPQDERVIWPVWGSVVAVDEPVVVRLSLDAGSRGTAGVVFAGAGAPETRRALELVARDGAWRLRETVGGEVVSEVGIEAPAAADFVVELGRGGRSLRVTGHGAEQSLVAAAPLVAPGETVGVDVRLDPGAELRVGELSMDRAAPATPWIGTPLREVAGKDGLVLGTATDVWPPRHDAAFETLLGQHFAAIAPTELYWATTRGQDEDYFFLPADLMINYAAVHDQAVTGYFLVWDYELPAWLQALAARGDAAEVGAALDEHIATVVGRYRDRVDAWVVVNEAVWGPKETGGVAGYADSLWLEALGPAYIERAFRAARAADDDAVLIYNETGAEALGPKSDFVYRMMAELVARGVPVDGVGLQLHIDAAAPPDLADVKANMARLGALGLSVHITELDVSLARIGGSAAAARRRQAEIYAGVLDACEAVPACESYTVFGFGDVYAWDELGDASPLLMDERYRPKPALSAVRRAIGP